MKTSGLFIFAIIIIFYSCGSTKDISNEIKYEISDNILYISEPENAKIWPKNIEIATKTGTPTYYLRSSSWESSASVLYSNRKNRKGYCKFEISQDFSIKPKRALFYRDYKVKYSESDYNCLKEWFPELRIDYEIEDEWLSVDGKKFEMYKIDFNNDKIKHYTTKLNLKFVDEQSETPLNGNIYFSYHIVKKTSEKYNTLKNYGLNCGKLYNDYKKLFDYRVELYLKKIGPLENIIEKNILNSEYNINENVIDEFELIVSARTPNRSPISFKIKGNKNELEQSYLIKWPSLPLNVNITEKVIEPKIIKVN